MATPRTTLWKRDPHTAAKHQILHEYLQAWFRIIGSRFPSCTYVDGFSGPGEYLGGEDGSPIIALRVASECDEVRSKPVRFLMLDEDPGRVEHLVQRLDVRCPPDSRPPQADIVVRKGTCATDLEPLLAEHGCWGFPIFALLDSFGGAAVPFRLVERIAKSPSSEVMVTLAPSFFARFVSTKPETGDEVFGSTAWRAVAEQPSERKHDFIAEQYLVSLKTAGFTFVLPFELNDEGGRPLYLLFGTKNLTGLARMKDAMWKVDPAGGLTFRDPRIPGQLAFEVATPQFGGLEAFLFERLAYGPLLIDDLRDDALTDTIYRREDVISALRRMRDRGLVEPRHGRLVRKTVVRRA